MQLGQLGRVVLMLSKDATLTPATVKARLMQSAHKTPGDPTAWGAGTLDIAAALAATGQAQTALSPKMTQDPATGAIFVEDTGLLWGNPQWNANLLWSEGYAWSNGYPWSNVVNDFTALYDASSQSIILNDDPQ